MAKIEFADGFDVPEPLAWGLTPAQLGAAITGTVVAYVAIRSPLPRIAAFPVAVIAASAGLTVALARRHGRALISWAGVAARFWTRPRHGLLVVTGCAAEPWDQGRTLCSSRREGVSGEIHGPSGLTLGPAWEGRTPMVEIPHRVPLVLLPEPVELPPVPPPGIAVGRSRAGAGMLEVGDAAGIPALRATRRIVFFSLSGGAGRTTLAAEVAGLLAGRADPGNGGRWVTPPRVALVDLDLLSPRAGIRLGVPASAHWDLARGNSGDRLVERLMAVHASGLRVIPGPARVLPAGTGDRPDVVFGAAAAVAELERRGCDTVVLDLAADLSALTRWALQSADDVLVVLTPTAGGVQDAYRTTEVLRALGLRHRIRYVVNRSRGEAVFDEAMADLGGGLAAEIPDDPALERAEADHRLVGLETTGRTAAALRGLAATVDARFPARSVPAPASAMRRMLRRRAV